MAPRLQNETFLCEVCTCWTPSRLVDIGDQSRFRLFLPENEQTLVSEYATLSYRWGIRGSDMKLTTQKFGLLCSGLPFSELPQDFQDAILVTKELGIRFLWIDALCIRHDGTDDFHRECAQMSEIYATSAFNIIATFGTNPGESLFQHRCFGSLGIGRATGVWQSNQQTLNGLD